MNSAVFPASPALRCCTVLAALACLAGLPAQADTLRLTETVNDTLKCKYDRDLEEKVCSVTTTGRYDVTLKISAAALEANDIDLATLLEEADGEQSLWVSLGIGSYQFDGDVYEGSDYRLTDSSVKAQWVTTDEKCPDADCAEPKTVQTAKLKLSGSVAGGLTFRLKGSSLNNDYNGYGESLYSDICSETGTVEGEETVSLILGDGYFVELPVTLKCRVRTVTKRRGDAGDFDLVRQRITAKLGDAAEQQ